jgi:hypothetical protein
MKMHTYTRADTNWTKNNVNRDYFWVIVLKIIFFSAFYHFQNFYPQKEFTVL